MLSPQNFCVNLLLQHNLAYTNFCNSINKSWVHHVLISLSVYLLLDWSSLRLGPGSHLFSAQRRPQYLMCSGHSVMFSKWVKLLHSAVSQLLEEGPMYLQLHGVQQGPNPCRHTGQDILTGQFPLVYPSAASKPTWVQSLKLLAQWKEFHSQDCSCILIPQLSHWEILSNVLNLSKSVFFMSELQVCCKY